MNEYSLNYRLTNEELSSLKNVKTASPEELKKLIAFGLVIKGKLKLTQIGKQILKLENSK